MMYQTVSERRNSQFRFAQLLCTGFIRIELAAVFAFPICNCAGFRAGCSFCAVRNQMMFLSRLLKADFSDVSAFADAVIAAADITRTGDMVFFVRDLFRIAVLRYNAQKALSCLSGLTYIRNLTCRNCPVYAVRACNLHCDLMVRFGAIQFIHVILTENGTCLIILAFDFDELRLIVNCSVCIANNAFTRLECIISGRGTACYLQFAGAVQVDISLRGRQCTVAVFELQIAVSDDGQILRCKDYGSTEAVRGLGNSIVTDQMNSQCILRNDRRLCIVCESAERSGGCCGSGIFQREVFERQGFACRIIVPAVLFQITEIGIRHD